MHGQQNINKTAAQRVDRNTTKHQQQLTLNLLKEYRESDIPCV